jgi:cytochrome c biogenesis protein CcmG/thiol:disulfide interchange protein DsbE
MGITLARQGEGHAAGFGINAVGALADIQVRPATDFIVPQLSGGTFRLSEQRGHPVVVNFWASWCPPCQDEARAFESAWQVYRGRGVVFLGIDVWDKDADARAFINQFGLTYPNGLDTSATTVEYGVTGIPETFAIDSQGRVIRHWVGPMDAVQLRGFIDGILE